MNEKMNPEVKTKWLEALRGGEYKQARGVLRTAEDGYCCLGVLSQIASDEGVMPQPEKSQYGESYAWVNKDGMTTNNMYLPKDVMAWSGLDSSSGEINNGNCNCNLAKMNDKGHTFDEIADIIEENL